jgi:hypothetical protein
MAEVICVNHGAVFLVLRREWELYRRGFDSNHIFSVDEYYWEDLSRYYGALQAVRVNGDDLTSWLEYNAEGLKQPWDGCVPNAKSPATTMVLLLS